MNTKTSSPHGVRIALALWLVATVGLSGCRTLDLDSVRTVAQLASFGQDSALKVRKTPRNPLTDKLNLFGWGGPQPTDRTIQLLRRYDLEEAYEVEPNAALVALQQQYQLEPTLDKLHALSELSYVLAVRHASRSRDALAMNLYGASMVYAHEYLFLPQFDRQRNTFDPEFRNACNLYNSSLEGLLRMLDERGDFRPGAVQSLEAVDRRIDFTVTVHGPWHPEDIAELEFASDYEVHGLTNRYQTYGLGVPLIAKRRPHDNETAEEQYYPKGLTFPVTAFFRVLPLEQLSGENAQHACRCAVELHDPLTRTQLQISGQQVALESDITTPLAYYLNDPLVSTNALATFALLNAEFAKDLRGLYMLEPYDPNRIPVVMVHGLWSSPTTWMEMFNDLRAMPEIRERYQFWFYMYPTGQPFWVSARQMREDLNQAIGRLDPGDESEAIDNLVLVGHSMGGLVSRLQTMYSEDDFWNIVSDKPFNDLSGEEQSREQLRQVLFFEPNHSIRRVVTIGTPHQGSDFANPVFRWLSRRVFVLPAFLRRNSQNIIRENPGFFRNTELLTIDTSIDSLAPDSPVFPVMLEARRAPWVRMHNIVGRAPKRNLFEKLGTKVSGEGDGVVSLASASLQGVESQVEVSASHSVLHQHPRTILEVRRILLQHLNELPQEGRFDPAVLPVQHEQNRRSTSLEPLITPMPAPGQQPMAPQSFQQTPQGATHPPQPLPPVADGAMRSLSDIAEPRRSLETPTNESAAYGPPALGSMGSSETGTKEQSAGVGELTKPVLPASSPGTSVTRPAGAPIRISDQPAASTSDE